MSDSFYEVCLHGLFSAQAARTPSALALEQGASAWTYAELEQRSNGIARMLGERGVERGAFVALLAARSPHAISAMLGILKAGAAYVPLDPRYPFERLTWMLQDCGARLVLTDTDMEAFAGVPAINVARVEAVEANGSAAYAADAADAAAYLIYTSGSAGRPKGVVVEHASVVNYVRAFAEKLGISGADRLLQLGSLSFDLSVEEIFGALLHGATLCLRSESMLDSMAQLAAGCAGSAITILDLPTALWHELCAAMDAGVRLPASVRVVVIGGERADAAALARFHAHTPASVVLLSTYGPTEATIAVTWAELRRGAQGEPPIGVPVPNVVAYVVADTGQLAACDEPGELWVGGACLARGYLNLPELTAQRFIPNPFGSGRVYRTGDVVLRRSDQQLYYVGRTDQQLKLRGFRIEPGEIEAQLTALSGVRQAAVALQGSGARARLVAYFTGSRAPSELGPALRATLPPHLVPAQFVALAALPLTPNGKLDRAKLSEVSIEMPLEVEYVAPRTAVEAVLCELLAELLGLVRVGIREPFFELGLDSILAARLLGLAHVRLGQEISLQMLFEASSVEGLAKRVEGEPKAAPTIKRLRRPS